MTAFIGATHEADLAQLWLATSRLSRFSLCWRGTPRRRSGWSLTPPMKGVKQPGASDILPSLPSYRSSTRGVRLAKILPRGVANFRDGSIGGPQGADRQLEGADDARHNALGDKTFNFRTRGA